MNSGIQAATILLRQNAQALGLSSLKGNMDAWYDGSNSGSQLLDVSGKARHATLKNDLMTDGDAELNSSLNDFNASQPVTTKSSSNVDARTGSSGTRCFDVTFTIASGFAGVKSKPFIVVAGETINYSFWIKRINNTTLFWGIRPDTGAADYASGNSTTQAIVLPAPGTGFTLNTWVKVQGSFTAPVSSGRTYFYVFSSVAAASAFRLDDIDINVNGQTNISFEMPNVAALKTIDVNNRFYDASGIPLKVRGAYSYNADTRQIYCGGAFKYIFLNAAPSYSTWKILADQFQDLDFAFTSCPVSLTVGSGKTYAKTQLAIDGSTSGGAGTYLHRKRVLVYDDETFATYADYTKSSGGGSFQAAWQLHPDYIYIDAVGSRTITLTKAVSSTDTQLRFTEAVVIPQNGGLRGFVFAKSNGGYFWHVDNTSSPNKEVIVKDCQFIDSGAAAVFAYRTANSLPMPNQEITWSALAGGAQPNFILRLKNVVLQSRLGMSWQDVATTSAPQYTYCDNVTMTGVDLYDPVSNPTSNDFYGMRLLHTGGSNALNPLFFKNSTRNSLYETYASGRSLITTGL